MTEKKRIRAVAIDGPAGAGKSTIAKAVSRALGWVYVDTGAMFRSMALFLLNRNISEWEQAEVSRAVADANVVLSFADGEQHIILNGEDVSDRIRDERVGNAASRISIYPEVREAVMKLEQNAAEKGPVVMDGRDIGTVVLPFADTKIFLTASAEVRAKRRAEELRSKGEHCETEDILRDIRERDERDRSRETAPLRQAEDAVLIDSSELTVDEVVRRILALVRERESKETLR